MPLARIADLNGPIEEVLLRVNQAKKLSSIYDDFILLDEEDNGSDRAPGIHASELYPCMRKSVYSLNGVPRKPVVHKFWRQRFKMGHAIHDFVQTDFTRMAKRSQEGKAMRVAEKMAEELDCYMHFEKEVQVSPAHQEIAKYYNIYSHCDGVFTFTDKKTAVVVLRVGLEIKSEAPDGYDKLRAPKEEHVRQVHTYMATLDLPLLWFFYQNKGNQTNTNSETPWVIVFQPRIWKEIEDRCVEVHTHVHLQTMPERTAGIWCEFCPWLYECKPSNVQQHQQPLPAKRPRFTLPIKD